MKTIVNARGRRGAEVNHLLRVMRRGWGYQRLEECYNSRMLADRGDAEWCSAMDALLVRIDNVPCEQ